jgi:mono/diheme cytochrome c family protein
MVPSGNLSFQPGKKLAILAANGENESSACKIEQERNVNRILVILGIAALALGGVILTETYAANGSASSHDAASVAAGKKIFQEKCSICHFDTSAARKIGPGLKGLNKRGTFTVNKNKVTDETLTKWIESGDSLMPPFKDVLDAKQIKDVVAYVRTL